MSTRGINFLDKCTAEQLPETATDDPIVFRDLADKALRAAVSNGPLIAGSRKYVYFH